MTLRRLILVFLMCVPIAATAGYTLPNDDRILQVTGVPSVAASSSLRLLVWNVQKQSGGETWRRDFNSLLRQSDVAFVQEGFYGNLFWNTINDVSGFQWVMVTSFLMGGTGTGVASASRWPLANPVWWRSPGREPVVRTPKTALSLLIPLVDGRNLLAINIHAMNFVGSQQFENQLTPLFQQLRLHRGPAIFAGDFNTWSGKRLRHLRQEMQKAELREAILTGDSRRLVLDHVYYRGLSLKRAVLRNDVSSSDHKPIQAVFSSWPSLSQP